MLVRGIPQMRHSEGNRTVKRPSAARFAHPRPRGDETALQTTEGPTTAMVAWLARIRSSLLLKTASSFAAKARCD